MSPRLPEFDVAAATPAQAAVLEDILRGPRGNLDGPFLSWIHSPELAQLAQQLGAFCRYRTGLPLALSELAILCTAARWRSQAEWQIHHPIGLDAGLDATQIEAIRAGHPPRFEDPAQALIWRTVDELYERRRLSDATYEALIARFGLETTVNLTGLLGYYALVAMTLNVFHVVARGGQELPFSEFIRR
ncbi:carboxymuconolactone decarboxylase family protein [Roseateles sp. L2-2]|uniref:carboxymuconolactone decarboxylase family protein n=1 Tax=Roseateles sp. L2-2 TaxID=3422597 RepID=UPI003D361CC5